MMDDYQHENPMCSFRVDDLNDNFSFSFSFENMVVREEQVKEHEQEEYHDSEFEFICITPDSPNSDPEKNSPADHLFFNGRLQPHSFPFQAFNDNRIDYSRCTSLTSSISSKNSFASSRSNSTNSSNSRSSFSSARTSSSEYRDKRALNLDNVDAKTTIKGVHSPMIKPCRLQPITSSKKWQFITPAPVLMTTADLPRRKTNESSVQQEARSNKQVEKTGESSCFGLRLFRSIISACRECHALEPSEKQDGFSGDIQL